MRMGIAANAGFAASRLSHIVAQCLGRRLQAMNITRNDKAAKATEKGSGRRSSADRVLAPTVKQGDRKSVLFAFFDLNLQSADYRGMIHEADKDAK
jgi:hypothetical protein